MAAVLLSACGGGGGGGSSVPSGGGGSTPSGTSYTLSTSGPTSITLGSGASAATMTFPAASASASITVGNSAGAGVQSLKTQTASGLYYVSVTASSPVTVGYPTFTTTLPAVDGVAFASTQGQWNYTTYSGIPYSASTPNSGTFTASGSLVLSANQTVYFAVYEGTPSSGQSNIAYNCPSSQATLNSVAVKSSGTDKHIAAPRMPSNAASRTGSLIAVEYDRNAYQRSPQSFISNATTAGGTIVKTLDFSHIGKVMHVLSVPSAAVTTTMASLRAQSGVIAVGKAGYPRYLTAVTHPYITNDPYFQGFTGSNSPPYYESETSVNGQWDMHAIGMEYAYAYSESAATNGSGYTAPLAIGSNTIPIAIVDTGVDATHPELSGKVVYQRCFITDNNNNQSTGNYATDSFGHGTDVAGIAADTINNGLGFIGTGGNSVIYAYRVFPTFDDACNNPNSNDPQCESSDADIASAINDAVNPTGVPQARVISISLGGQGCTTITPSTPLGDPSFVEGAAIQNALAAGIIVVAAAGNDGVGTVDSPACDAGVIAVGATSLDDGTPNGALSTGGNAGGTPSTPIEYVASYSNYGTTNTFQSSSSWGIVAPGGDPANTDNDGLHWIENIWTSTPFDSSDAQNCNPDYGSSNNIADCRVGIAGTSQATPHVSGVVALLCAISTATYCSGASASSQMLTYLCTYADKINTVNNPATGDPHEGCGRLSARKAIGHAAGDPNP